MHVIDENGASALCVSSARSMTPALSSGRTPDEGGAETCGIEVRTDENREACRVVEGVRVAVGAGDIPGATTMDLTLGKSSEQDTLADEPGDQAGNLGRAHGEVCGPVRHSASLPFSPTHAPPRVEHRESQGSDCSAPVGAEGSEAAGTVTSAASSAAAGEAIGTTDKAFEAGVPTTAPEPGTALDCKRRRLSRAENFEGVPTGSHGFEEKGVKAPPGPRRRGYLRALLPHVRFLQAAFRRTTARWPGCWCAGGLSGRLWLRPVVHFACSGSCRSGQRVVSALRQLTATAELGSHARGSGGVLRARGAHGGNQALRWSRSRRGPCSSTGLLAAFWLRDVLRG